MHVNLKKSQGKTQNILVTFSLKFCWSF